MFNHINHAIKAQVLSFYRPVLQMQPASLYLQRLKHWLYESSGVDKFALVHHRHKADSETHWYGRSFDPRQTFLLVLLIVGLTVTDGQCVCVWEWEREWEIKRKIATVCREWCVPGRELEKVRASNIPCGKGCVRRNWVVRKSALWATFFVSAEQSLLNVMGQKPSWAERRVSVIYIHIDHLPTVKIVSEFWGQGWGRYSRNSPVLSHPLDPRTKNSSSKVSGGWMGRYLWSGPSVGAGLLPGWSGCGVWKSAMSWGLMMWRAAT